jgi:hypothetical protein
VLDRRTSTLALCSCTKHNVKYTGSWTHLSSLVDIPTLDLGDPENLLGFPVRRFDVKCECEAVDSLFKVGLSEICMGLCYDDQRCEPSYRIRGAEICAHLSGRSR